MMDQDFGFICNVLNDSESIDEEKFMQLLQKAMDEVRSKKKRKVR